MTFKSGKVQSLAKEHYSEGRKGTSVDLKSATDRLPVRLTTRVLAEYWSAPELANDWEELMLASNYLCKKGDTISELNYSVGQPMGLYSS